MSHVSCLSLSQDDVQKQNRVERKIQRAKCEFEDIKIFKFLFFKVEIEIL